MKDSRSSKKQLTKVSKATNTVVVSFGSLYWCQGSSRGFWSPLVLHSVICLDTEYHPLLNLLHQTVQVGEC
jgi:hypothetical protein